MKSKNREWIGGMKNCKEEPFDLLVCAPGGKRNKSALPKPDQQLTYCLWYYGECQL